MSPGEAAAERIRGEWREFSEAEADLRALLVAIGTAAAFAAMVGSSRPEERWRAAALERVGERLINALDHLARALQQLVQPDADVEALASGGALAALGQNLRLSSSEVHLLRGVASLRNQLQHHYIDLRTQRIFSGLQALSGLTPSLAGRLPKALQALGVSVQVLGDSGHGIGE